MNKIDRDNLDYFLTASSEEFDRWLQQATPEQVMYAINLLLRNKMEENEFQVEVLEDAHVTQEFPDAMAVINRIKGML